MLVGYGYILGLLHDCVVSRGSQLQSHVNLNVEWMEWSKNGSGSNCCIIVYMYEIHWKFQTINCVNLILKYFMRGGINFMCLSEVYVGRCSVGI